MGLIIKLTFPAGRYHATPWGRHVNEGVPEWPPSPWRLLRALVAVWRRTCPDLPEPRVRAALEPLLHPPRFQLPPHRVAHTRHYMPWEKKGPDDRTLVLDTFIVLNRAAEVFLHWPEADPDDEDRATLTQLLTNLTFLGRAESWTHAELAEVIDRDADAQPSIPAAAAADETNPVRVLCADPETALSGEHYPTHAPAKLRRGLKPDERLFDCPRWHLALDTQTIHNQRWPQVPGAVWVPYTRPTTRQAPAAKPRSARQDTPTVARFLLDGPVLPRTTDTILVADAFRRAAMSRFNRWCRKRIESVGRQEAGELQDRYGPADESDRFSSPVLSGKDRHGRQRRCADHAHYLPIAGGDNPRTITHVVVYAPEGLGDEMEALSTMKQLNALKNPLKMRLVDRGRPKDYAHHSFATSQNPFRESSVWESATPFYAHRHLKRRGRRSDMPHLEDPSDPRGSFLKLSIRELARRRNLPEIEEVRILNEAPNDIPPHEFRRARPGRSGDGRYRYSGYLRLRFSQPVPGPLCLGYGSFFGLGAFVAGE